MTYHCHFDITGACHIPGADNCPMPEPKGMATIRVNEDGTTVMEVRVEAESHYEAILIAQKLLHWAGFQGRLTHWSKEDALLKGVV